MHRASRRGAPVRIRARTQIGWGHLLPPLGVPTNRITVQARALGAGLPDLTHMRDLVRTTHDLAEHRPADLAIPGTAWAEAAARLGPRDHPVDTPAGRSFGARGRG